MLAGKGFNQIINLTGGIKGWNSETAVGPLDLGMELFTGNEPPEKTLAVAYSLEDGLRDFYQSMIPKIENAEARKIFEKLSEIETKHQDKILQAYQALAGPSADRETFIESQVTKAVEGGLTTEDYLARLSPNLESAGDVIELAMSIEAQALDLYTRAADQTEVEKSREILIQIANEEKAHIAQLGKLIEAL